MARKGRTPEENARRAKIREVLQESNISSMEDIEEKILSMYAKGMATSDIEAHIHDIYGLDVSDTTVSRITDKICLSSGSGRTGRWRAYARWY